MKYLYIVIVLVILVGVYMFTSKDVASPEMDMGTEAESTEMTEEASSEGEESGSDTEMESESEMEGEVEVVGEVVVDLPDVVGTAKEFTLDGFNYGYSSTEIRVKEGDVVTINLTVSEGFHDWVVDEFDAATDKIRSDGSPTSVTFVADKKGSFEFYCSVGEHRENGMVGTLVVE